MQCFHRRDRLRRPYRGCALAAVDVQHLGDGLWPVNVQPAGCDGVWNVQRLRGAGDSSVTVSRTYIQEGLAVTGAGSSRNRTVWGSPMCSQLLDQVPVRADQVPVRPGQVLVRPDQVPVRPDQVPVRPDQVPVRPDQVPVRPGQVPVRADQVPVRPGQVPGRPDQVPVRPGQVPVRPGQVPVRPGQVPGRPDQVTVPGAAEEGGQREQLPTEISDDGRLAFRQKDLQNESYREIVDKSANILDFARGRPSFAGAPLYD